MADDPAFHKLNNFAKDRIEDPVLHEAWNLAFADGLISERLDEPAEVILDCGRRLIALHYLDHRYEVRWVRPVHADDSGRSVVALCDLRDRDTRRVRRERRSLGSERSKVAEHLLLEIEIL